MEVYRVRLVTLGPPLASEKLAKRGIAEIGHEILRRRLTVEGLWQRRRRRGPPRRWRLRRARCGELVQVDGSHHDWFGTGAQACLMKLVNDATGATLARMHAHETTEAAMRVLWTWIEG